jgi:hypothetical protein
MARTERYEEHGSVSKGGYADFLRVLTVERFTVWKPPASATDRVAPLGTTRTQAAAGEHLGRPQHSRSGPR